ncbi:hypothetical protein DB30_03673 [Enhygromyxa salina]|uniref:Uncharacterized protein n=1 Tax=Enhygromyxa salina TaxID=215803 RepID=A0A0C2D1G1_9BACT|nr:hypothetical protein DB30_03673 [Enhygromyxa salina]
MLLAPLLALFVAGLGHGRSVADYQRGARAHPGPGRSWCVGCNP